MFFVEIPQARAEPIGGKGSGCGNRQRAFERVVFQCKGCSFDVFERGKDVGCIVRPIFGELQRPCQSMKQRLSQLFLKRFDLVGYGGGRHAQFICGISPDSDNDPDCLDLETNPGFFENELWPMLAERVPAFEAIKMVTCWAGHYAYNTLDQNAILGSVPTVNNLLLANGFSGHGLQQAPATGRGVSELITYGGYRSLDLTPVGYERIVENRPFLEQAVI